MEDAYASTLAHESGFRPSQPEVIEPAARKVHMISEKIEAPEDTAGDAASKPSSDEQTSGSAEQTPDAAPEQQPENPEKIRITLFNRLTGGRFLRPPVLFIPKQEETFL